MKLIFSLLFITTTFSSFSKDSLTPSIAIKDTVLSNTLNNTDSVIWDSSKSIDSCLNNITVQTNRKTEYPTFLDYLKYILPIFTLILGIAINRGLDYFSNKKRIKQSGKRWTAELISLQSPIKNQIGELNKFKQELLEDTFDTPRLTLYSILACDVFSSLDKSHLLEFIEIKTKKGFNDVVKISNNIHGYVSIMTHLHDSLKDKFNNFLTKTSTHINGFNKGLQNLLKAFNQYGLEIEKSTKKDPISDPNYKQIWDLFSIHILSKMEKGNYNPYEMKKTFFPQLSLTLSRLRLDERTNPLAEAVAELLHSIKGMQFEKQYMIENLETIIKHYHEQIEQMDDVLKEIKN